MQHLWSCIVAYVIQRISWSLGKWCILRIANMMYMLCQLCLIQAGVEGAWLASTTSSHKTWVALRFGRCNLDIGTGILSYHRSKFHTFIKVVSRRSKQHSRHGHFAATVSSKPKFLARITTPPVRPLSANLLVIPWAKTFCFKVPHLTGFLVCSGDVVCVSFYVSHRGPT